MTDKEEVRRQFEVWATSEELSVTRNNPLDVYDDLGVEARWIVWQAALSSPAVVALVEAAKDAFAAWNYLSALYASDPSPDLKKAVDCAWSVYSALIPFTTGAGHE